MSETLTFFYHDHLGSVIGQEEFDSAGNLLNTKTNSYDLYGNPIDKINACFTGKYMDKTGLYYFNARYYDPKAGRFITEDPARQGEGWYNYCSGNPLNRVDPDGRQDDEFGILEELEDLYPDKRIKTETFTVKSKSYFSQVEIVGKHGFAEEGQRNAAGVPQNAPFAFITLTSDGFTKIGERKSPDAPTGGFRELTRLMFDELEKRNNGLDGLYMGSWVVNPESRESVENYVAKNGPLKNNEWIPGTIASKRNDWLKQFTEGKYEMELIKSVQEMPKKDPVLGRETRAYRWTARIKATGSGIGSDGMLTSAVAEDALLNNGDGIKKVLNDISSFFGLNKK